MDQNKQRLSMIRSYTLADLFTLGNASCGTLTIFLCLAYIANEKVAELWAAFILPLVALAFDALDGYIARLDKRRQSLLGADLDSLADIVSFGVAPAVLGFTLGLRGFWDVLILTYFVCCGISRLARFNVTSASLTNQATGKVKYFEGTPIPTSVLLVIAMAVIYRLGLTGENFLWGDWIILKRAFHPFTILFAVSGSLMISTIKVPKP
ncbi:MAG TPA: CDP-diacylglycerol--serine O-phosphatidyltransferase [Candidatus Kapabacteria bacterium]|nr:CDP-diacylglycerol--serine O-phosphatidyltransferase [Candidatus Kapabacteria bacterium]